MDRCVLVREGAGYRFFTASSEAGKLDGRCFPSIRKAESVVRQLMMAVDRDGSRHR